VFHPQTILLVEDFDADVFRFRCALSALNFPGKLRVAATVSQARDYLQGRDGYADRDYYPLPSLVVSDLQFRGESGWQFLRWLRADPDHSHIPVVVLSGVVEPIEHDLLVKEGAREVFEKCGDYAVMKGIVARILTHLPRNAEASPSSAQQEKLPAPALSEVSLPVPVEVQPTRPSP
jgi:CheY-like chemotaxis protein